MKSLENEMGVALFNRSRRPPQLNAAGYALIPNARALIYAYESLGQSLKDGMGPLEKLTIGPIPTTMSGLIPRALKELQDNYSRLQIRVYPGLSSDMYTRVDC